MDRVPLLAEIISQTCIDENLQTHDFDQLCNRLKKTFPKTVVDYYAADFTLNGKKACWLILSPGTEEDPVKTKIERITNDPKFKKLLELYGYVVSKVELSGIEPALLLEPIETESESVMEYIQNKCQSRVYHTCQRVLKKDNGEEVYTAESILRNGLRCRTPEYRYYPKRIYAWAIPSWKATLKNIVAASKEMGFDGDLSIFEINLDGQNIQWYEDTAVDSDYGKAVFTQTNIPPSLITKIN